MTPAQFTDAGAVAQGVGAHLGAGAGVVFAIALLNASMLGACVVSLITAGGLALATSYLRDRRPSSPLAPLTPWQRRTWSAPTLELVKPASPNRPRLLALAILRGYILTIAALLLLKLVGALHA